MTSVSQARGGRCRDKVSDCHPSPPVPSEASGRGFCCFLPFYSDVVSNFGGKNTRIIFVNLSPDLPINISLLLLYHSLPPPSLPTVSLPSLCLSLPPLSLSASFPQPSTHTELILCCTHLSRSQNMCAAAMGSGQELHSSAPPFPTLGSSLLVPSSVSAGLAPLMTSVHLHCFLNSPTPNIDGWSFDI